MVTINNEIMEDEIKQEIKIKEEPLLNEPKGEDEIEKGKLMQVKEEILFKDEPLDKNYVEEDLSLDECATKSSMHYQKKIKNDSSVGYSTSSSVRDHQNVAQKDEETTEQDFEYLNTLQNLSSKRNTNFKQNNGKRDLSVVNAWLLHRRMKNKAGYEKTMSLCDFKEDLAAGLMTKEPSKRGRPSTSSECIGKRRRVSAQPAQSTRLDAYSHWPEWSNENQRCKHCIKAHSMVRCIKCNVSLCFNKRRNCFKEYHEK